MKNFAPAALAIDSGNSQIFDHIDDEGPMWSGTGKRWSSAWVTFDSPFAEPPVVQLSIGMIDADSGRNLRLELSAEDITEQGFNAMSHTWGDTRIGRLRVNWTAIGTRTAGIEPIWDV